MGGTFDEVPIKDPELSTPLAAGNALDHREAHARCWVLRDRMRSTRWFASVVGADEPQDLF